MCPESLCQLRPLLFTILFTLVSLLEPVANRTFPSAASPMTGFVKMSFFVLKNFFRLLRQLVVLKTFSRLLRHFFVSETISRLFLKTSIYKKIYLFIKLLFKKKIYMRLLKALKRNIPSG